MGVKYFDMWDPYYRVLEFNISIFIMERGCGKTFSGLSAIPRRLLPEHAPNMILSRVSRKEIDLIASDTGSVFKDINHKYVTDYHIDREGDMFVARNADHKGAPHVLIADLTTLAQGCGASYRDYSVLLLDEFVPPGYVRGIRNKYTMLMSAWETANRNREFDGSPPIRLILCSNANDIYDPILAGLGLTYAAEQMVRTGQEHWQDRERSIAMHIMRADESFKEAKSKSAVARATKGTEYGAMAFSNEFALNDFSFVRGTGKNLRGARPLYCLNRRLYMYEMPDGTRFASYRKADVAEYDTRKEFERKRFRLHWDYELQLYMDGMVSFQTYDLKALYMDAIGISRMRGID